MWLRGKSDTSMETSKVSIRLFSMPSSLFYYSTISGRRSHEFRRRRAKGDFFRSFDQLTSAPLFCIFSLSFSSSPLSGEIVRRATLPAINSEASAHQKKRSKGRNYSIAPHIYIVFNTPQRPLPSFQSCAFLSGEYGKERE